MVAAMATRHLVPPEHYDLSGTLRAMEMKSAGKRVVLGVGFRRATRTPFGPGSMVVRKTGVGLEIEAWGPGSTWLLETAPDLAKAIEAGQLSWDSLAKQL